MSERRSRSGGRILALAFVCAALQVVVPAADGATIRLINRDGAGEGFNDPTPATPVGGNSGTTLGQQRLIAFQYAVDKWAALLQSPVEIRISATFDALECDSNSATLGQAGPVFFFKNFAGAPASNTFYASALADRLAGMDLAPEGDDIDAQFNSSLGTTCAFPAGWYYGLDGATSGDDSDLVTVVLHELGHGLGFLTLVDNQTGALFMGSDDAFMTFLVDDRSGKAFTDMTDAERKSAIVATGHLKWDGSQVVAASGKLKTGADASGRVQMYAPSPPQQGSSVSHWSDVVLPDELMEPIFTQPIHDPGLALQALADTGWNAPGAAICLGDCNGDNRVVINELITGVGIALGGVAASACAAIDGDGNGMVAVNELVGAVGHALNGCPSDQSTPTPTATPNGATPTATPTLPSGSCPVDFRDDSVGQSLLCLYTGSWNSSCGDDGLEASFASNGTVFIGVLGTNPLIGLAGNVTSASKVVLKGWFTDFDQLSDFTMLSGSATLADGGATLRIQPSRAPFAINDCNFVDYWGSFTRTVQGGTSQINSERLLPLVQQRLAGS